MLQSLRDKAQGWIAWVIIGLVGITFVLFGVDFQSSGSRERSVAKVNGSKITAHELDIQYQQILRQQGNESVVLPDSAALKKEILQSLIEQTILLQTAQKMGMTISPTRIGDFLNSVPFLRNENGQFSEEAYRRFLATQNYTDQSFKAMLKDTLLKEELQQAIMQTAFSLPSEVQELAKFELQKRDFRFTILAKAPIEKSITLTDADVQQYYDSHKSDFMTPERLSLEYVLLSLKEGMDKIQPTEDEIENYYQENIATFTQPASMHAAHILITVPKEADAATMDKAMKRIQEIQQKIKAGESFEALAKKYSEDTSSAPSGGDLAWFIQGEMVPEFDKAAFALEKGQISEPVRTDFGIHLIKLLDKRQESVQPLETVKEEVTLKLKQHDAEEKFVQHADELSSIAYDSPESLQPAADKLNLTVVKTELFNANTGPQEKRLQHPAVMAAALSTAVKEDKNNSDLIKIDDENYVVVRVSEVIPSQQETFASVKEKIHATLLAQKTESALKAEADKIVAALKKEDNTQAAAQYTWTDKEGIMRTTKEIDADILTTAFAMPRPLESKEIIVRAARMANGDYAVVWLKGIHDGKEDTLNAEDKERYQIALAKHWGELEYLLYTNALFKNAKVEKHLDKI